MAQYAAFLRGMNLGRRRIKNDELRAVFEKLGFDDVATFRASGNVVFAGRGGEEADALTASVEAGLAKALGYDVRVFLRSAREVRAIAAHEPFKPAVVAASAGKLQVSLLPVAPSSPVRKRALAWGTDEDRLAIRGRELYWLPSGGMADSELDLKSLEAALGPWTMRTKGTIEEVAARYFAA